MMKQFIKDLPIYINGFCVGFLFVSNPNIKIQHIIMFMLASISFIWYGYAKSKK
jgi:hypothetical protein